MDAIYKNRLRAIVSLIKANPELHKQEHWACGTTRCIGGWAVDLFSESKAEFITSGWGNVYAVKLPAIEGSNYVHVMSDGVPGYKGNQSEPWAVHRTEAEALGLEMFRVQDVGTVARKILGLTVRDANGLFDGANTIEDIERMAEELYADLPMTHSQYCECATCADDADDDCDCDGCINDDGGYCDY